jgi:large subunit ribosomal protein L18
MSMFVAKPVRQERLSNFMATSSTSHTTFLRRKARTRARIGRSIELPRLSVHRTLRHMYAQIIDDKTGTTLVSSNDAIVKATGTKTEIARAIGTHLAEQAKLKKITSVRFDRGAFQYHGRVAALASAAREAGLTF